MVSRCLLTLSRVCGSFIRIVHEADFVKMVRVVSFSGFIIIRNRGRAVHKEVTKRLWKRSFSCFYVTVFLIITACSISRGRVTWGTFFSVSIAVTPMVSKKAFIILYRFSIIDRRAHRRGFKRISPTKESGDLKNFDILYLICTKRGWTTKRSH